MKRQLEIDYSFGYVFDKSKLIVMYPVGTNVISEEEYEMEVEIAFLEDGIEEVFEQEDIIQANDTIKPLEMFLMKPNKIIPFVTSIRDSETKTELSKLMKEFDKEYEAKENYISKGYQLKDIYHVFKNVADYIPRENLETLNILKVEDNKFNMNEFINLTRKNLDESMDSNLIPTIMSKSNLTDRLFVKEEKQENSMYVPFAIDSSTYLKGIICANGESIKELDVDMGDLEISNTKNAGYIIEKVGGLLTFKIANFNSQTENNHQVAQIVDYAGIIKPMMIDFINIFVK